jgi:hypothetical protein
MDFYTIPSHCSTHIQSRFKLSDLLRRAPQLTSKRLVVGSKIRARDDTDTVQPGPTSRRRARPYRRLGSRFAETSRMFGGRNSAHRWFTTKHSFELFIEYQPANGRSERRERRRRSGVFKVRIDGTETTGFLRLRGLVRRGRSGRSIRLIRDWLSNVRHRCLTLPRRSVVRYVSDSSLC